MDLGRIFSRALEISWRYKFLWVLGFVMALTGGGGGNFNLRFPSFGTTTPAPDTTPSPPQFDASVFVFIGLVAACIALLLLIATLYFRFVARGALVSAVQAIENGLTPTLGASWREGRTYYTRLLGLGFLVNIPLAILSLVIILVSIIPFLGAILLFAQQASQNQPPGPDFAPQLAGFFGFIALFCCGLACIGLISLIIHPIYEFAVRAIVLENERTLDGWSRGLRRLRENLGSVTGLYLLLIGARIGWSIVVGVVGFPFGLLIAGAVIATVGSNVSLAIALALVLGIPLALVLIFLEGLFQVFESNVWTEGYLALMAAPGTAAEPTLLPSPA